MREGHRADRLATKSGTALRVKDIAEVVQGSKIRLGHEGKAIRRADGTILDNDDVIFAQVMMRKGADSEPTLKGLHAKVHQLNNGILPPGVKMEPMIDRSDLLEHTLGTVLHNLGEGMILVTIILFFFLFNVRAALIVALMIPLSLLFASIWLDVTRIPVNLFRWARSISDGRGWRCRDGGKYRGIWAGAAHPMNDRGPSARLLTRSSAQCSFASPSSSPPICPSLPQGEGASFRPMA
jgi:hypothetical protein